MILYYQSQYPQIGKVGLISQQVHMYGTETNRTWLPTNYLAITHQMELFPMSNHTININSSILYQRHVSYSPVNWSPPLQVSKDAAVRMATFTETNPSAFLVRWISKACPTIVERKESA